MNISGIILLFLLIISIVSLFLWANAEFRRREAADKLIKRTRELENARRDITRMQDEYANMIQKSTVLDDAIKRVGQMIRGSSHPDTELVSGLYNIVSDVAPRTIVGMKRPQNSDSHRSENETKSVLRKARKKLGGPG